MEGRGREQQPLGARGGPHGAGTAGGPAPWQLPTGPPPHPTRGSRRRQLVQVPWSAGQGSAGHGHLFPRKTDPGGWGSRPPRKTFLPGAMPTDLLIPCWPERRVRIQQGSDPSASVSASPWPGLRPYHPEFG